MLLNDHEHFLKTSVKMEIKSKTLSRIWGRYSSRSASERARNFQREIFFEANELFPAFSRKLNKKNFFFLKNI